MPFSGVGFDSSLAEQIGWTLLHFGWQGALLALVLAVALAALRNASSTSRYLCACLTLGLMAAAPVLTFWFFADSYDVHGPLSLSATGGELALSVLSSLRPWLPWIAAGWFIGVALLFILRFGGLVFLRWSLRSDKTSLSDSRFLELTRRIGIRRSVRFVESLVLHAPATIGTLRPVILIPVGALTGLNPRYLDALILHELAHIRRQDFLINLLQTILETLFFFHPAVWWVSSQVRAERENCCDDLAVSVCGDEDVYANALVAMEDLRDLLPVFALGARGGQFLLRINRLLTPCDSRGSSRTFSAAILGGLCSTIAVILLCNQLLIGAAADRVRGPRDLQSLSTTVAQVLGFYGSDESASFPELRDAVRESAIESAEMTRADALVKALNRDPRPYFITRQVSQSIRIGEPYPFDRPAGIYGTNKRRQELTFRLHQSARAMQTADPDRAGQYARAALVMASQEEMLAGTLPLRRLLSDTLFLPLAQLTPQQGQRIRRALAEHERVTALAQQLEHEALNELGGDNQRGPRSKPLNPQHELDRLVALAAQRADIQLRIVKLYAQWLAVADDPSKAIALAAARSWRKSIPDAVFTRWLNDAETGRRSGINRVEHQFRRPTKNFSGSMTPVDSPLVVKWPL
jgi:beta-lactamase regulating signal transducer with metallopeptidase domain